MGLLKDVDVNGTTDNVRYFFGDEYNRLCRLAGGGITLTSPQIDGMPRATATGNSTEKQMIEVANYHLLVETVTKALNACSVQSRRILIDKFIRNEKDWVVAEKVGYSKTRYYHYLKAACCEFADTLEHYTSLLGDEELIEDLHAYKQQKSEL
ncbi:hypothetical protein H5S40_03430 [Limosilactobacillus sp. RRLNB_1_1]|uniref:Phage transcriptional regulator, ArpU family n=1 Tax=Limosilactobacillus albertensis TaxID=2759752 RepID=A0A7W3Y7P7_9LACO|nr:ArpU family phage packaging/lysis transcriptional regulator [Limosilactobacillus albertensis]MBB1069205.1 hypothetical protein [Limosilactobacillus albertensis]MCD7118497.1 hypothetical protein [Limosilactobacillus albertensis]MCD7128640.1 hypothetical protein [Limosilactobacillus albertensis]